MIKLVLMSMFLFSLWPSLGHTKEGTQKASDSRLSAETHRASMVWGVTPKQVMMAFPKATMLNHVPASGRLQSMTTFAVPRAKSKEVSTWAGDAVDYVSASVKVKVQLNVAAKAEEYILEVPLTHFSKEGRVSSALTTIQKFGDAKLRTSANFGDAKASYVGLREKQTRPSSQRKVGRQKAPDSRLSTETHRATMVWGVTPKKVMMAFPGATMLNHVPARGRLQSMTTFAVPRATSKEVTTWAGNAVDYVSASVKVKVQLNVAGKMEEYILEVPLSHFKEGRIGSALTTIQKFGNAKLRASANFGDAKANYVGLREKQMRPSIFKRSAQFVAKRFSLRLGAQNGKAQLRKARNKKAQVAQPVPVKNVKARVR